MTLSRKLIAAGAALVLVLAVVVLFAPSRRGTSLAPLPGPPKVGAVTPRLTTQLQFIGDVSPERATALSNELGVFLADFYGRAFLAETTDPAVDPASSGKAVGAESPPVDAASPAALNASPADPGTLVATGAKDAFSVSVSVFDSDAIRIFEGTVSYRGLVTADNQTAFGAFLGVVFEGIGHVESDPGLAATVHQFGTLRLVATPEGWRVAGFDVKLETRVQAPPTPSPAL